MLVSYAILLYLRSKQQIGRENIFIRNCLIWLVKQQ